MTMRLSILIISILISSTTYSKNRAGYTLFFETLSQLPESEALGYLKDFRHIMSQNTSSILAQALQTPSNPLCIKRKMKTCHPALYGENLCVAKSQKTTVACRKSAKNKKFHEFFKDPAFHRISWNSLGLKINKACAKIKKNSCLNLYQLKIKILMKNKNYLDRIRKMQSNTNK